MTGVPGETTSTFTLPKQPLFVFYAGASSYLILPG